MRTTPEQRTITYGKQWMRVIDAPNWVYHFGTVPAADAWTSPIHPDPVLVRHIELDHHAGHLRSTVYSRLNRDGWTEVVERGDVWPIQRHLFTELGGVGWDVRNLHRNSSAYVELTRAYSQWLIAQTNQTERRDYEWFAREVGQVVGATGIGYHSANRIGDRRLLLRFGTWAHAQGVHHELAARGFKVARVYPSNLDVQDRSES